MDNSGSTSQASNNSATGAIPVPAAWPGAFESFKQVKPAIKRVFWSVFLMYVGVYIISFVLSLILGRSSGGVFVAYIAEFCVEVIAVGAIITLMLAALKDGDITINNALTNGLNKFVTMLVVLIIVEVLTTASFILLIVPFFFVFPRLVMAPYLVIEQNLGIMEAVSSSWNMTSGHLGEIYGLIGLGILIALLCFTIIGIPFAIYWGVINYGSFVQLARYLWQANSSKTAPAQA